MNQDEIIEMARQAGFHEHAFPFKKFKFEDFAKRVEDAAFKQWAAQTKLAVQDEREACALIADGFVGQDLEHNFSALIAHNIRARS